MAAENIERLTSYKSGCKREMICRYEDCDTCEEYCPHMNEDNCHCLQEVLGKLAAYEDIGLTPEQLKEVDRLYAEKCKELAESEKRSFSGIEMVKIWANLKKFKEYQKLEKQGKLLQLPCAVGDTVYRINRGKKEPVITMRVIGVAIRNENELVIQTIDIADDNHNLYSKNSIGKTVFLTPEEAEAALKEMI